MIGASIGFGAKKITQYQYKYFQNEQSISFDDQEQEKQDLQDVEMLLEKTVLLIKVIGLMFVATGFVFVFL